MSEHTPPPLHTKGTSFTKGQALTPEQFEQSITSREAKHEEAQRERAKMHASLRMAEVAEELKRRAVFTKIEHSAPVRERQRVDATLAGLTISVLPTFDAAKPFNFSVSLDTAKGYRKLITGRELSFEGMLRALDDFLAGVHAGRVIG